VGFVVKAPRSPLIFSHCEKEPETQPETILTPFTMPSFRRAALFIALVAAQFNESTAFTPVIQGQVAIAPSTSSTATAMKTKQAPETKDDDTMKNSYGEVSRQYRRTVYSHDDWVKHRSPDRFIRNLKSFSSSGVIKNLGKEVIATTGLAAALVGWNMIFGEYQDLMSITHNGPLHDTLIPVLSLPLAPFTLSSPSLGLLLGKSLCIDLFQNLIYTLHSLSVCLLA